ncbi:MAG: ATP-dependent DNA helicase RecG [Bacteroidetes bacterium]|nr:MAG: ATP-dependent DNA helicase RecG [Bacteroidota bacterium]
MPADLLTSVEYLKGVGPQRAALLKKELGLFTLGDMLDYFPFRYIDRTKFTEITNVDELQGNVQIKGTLGSFSEMGAGRGKRLVAPLFDKSGSVELVWFKGQKWIKGSLKEGKNYIAYGKPNRFGHKYSIAHPEMELVEEKSTVKGLQPVYSSGEKLMTKGLNSKGIEKIIKTALPGVVGAITETLPDYLVKKLKLISREEAVMNIHQPLSEAWMKAAQFRLKFEELFILQLVLIRRKMANTQKLQGHVFGKVGENFNTFYHNYLPFELTGAQKRVIKEIRHDLGAGYHMNRLLQGDVGSGKTMVALLGALLAIDNGFQACVMAPTEILAQQHYASFLSMLTDMPIEIRLLTGSTKTAERKEIHQGLQDGTVSIIIGTHALIEKEVKFKNLGIAVIDEQHRFGVEQRAKMWRKNQPPPHVLVMTATPIPRTLAMTLYGDLDISVIDEMPPGRKPVVTTHRYDKHRLQIFGFIEKEIAKGRQVYVVYPLIEESEAFDYKDLMDGYESIARRFPMPRYQVSIVHGKMKSEAKEFEMQRFVKGETQIMVATTVIEVGVDVPNASIMVIESAERFGLSQLHQLRGRVGRGADQSYCILATGFKLSDDARKRISAMVETNDGFELSEVDLKLRGPGDLMGTQQSGILEFKIADLVRDQQLLAEARRLAIRIIEADPELENINNKRLKYSVEKLEKSKSDWSRIS